MPHLEWALLAQSFAIDRTTNALSVFNQIDEIGVPAEVVAPTDGKAVPLGPGFVVLALWSRSNATKRESTEVRVVVLSPASKELGASTAPLDLVEAPRGRTIVSVPVLPFVGAGLYEIRILLKAGSRWRKVGSVDLTVRHGANN